MGVPNSLKCEVPASKKDRTYRNVGYRYRKSTEFIEVSNAGIEAVPNFPKTGIEAVPNLPKYQVPKYRGRTELTEVSGTGIYRAHTPDILRYAPYRTCPCNIA